MNEIQLLPFDEYKNPRCKDSGLNNHYCYLDNLSKYGAVDEKSPDLASTLSECRGLHFDNIEASSKLSPSFSRTAFMPVIGGGDKNLLTEFSPPFVAIMLADVINSEGNKIKKNIRERLNIPLSSKMIIFLHGEDQPLENFSAHQRSIFKELAKEDIHAFIAPNFSVWNSLPIIDQSINQKRSLVSYELMHKKGLTVIPHFYWKLNYHYDIQRIAQWINTRPSINIIALNLQTYQSSSSWSFIMQNLSMLIKLIKKPVRFIINGPQEISRIYQLIQLLGDRLTLVGSKARMMSWSRNKLIKSPCGLKIVKYPNNNKTGQQQFNFVEIPKQKTPTPGELFKYHYELFTDLVKNHPRYDSLPYILQQTSNLLINKQKTANRTIINPAFHR